MSQAVIDYIASESAAIANTHVVSPKEPTPKPVVDTASLIKKAFI